ncbi:Non-specific serine/threonine protein kinase [Gloeothece citriformis PCC 7424]|uniref:Non-specific serine/threonine protein kinase n=1 Tax=Gloeothece citriformis (strain PCC 7424) TaxID=65393 RepID=B7KJA3_GLOC7|nr:DEAD/DEAH box helicase [Gloeothece citriformis]ACK72187.1 Non-specific serine/threonine protein kinase [Gloeothece citriformis PCC 7424]
MPTLHGSWILQSTQCYLFIWGETWQSVEPVNSSSISLHPFNLTQNELQSFLKTHQLELEPDLTGQWTTEIIAVPSVAKGRSKKFLPLLSEQESLDKTQKTSLVLQPWQVQGIRLTPHQGLKLFQNFPLSSLQVEQSFLGEDLQFWLHIYRWSLDLLVRNKVLPGIFRESDSQAKSCWYPLLDSAIDQARFAKFSQMMPLSCRAYLSSSEQEIEENLVFSEAQELLLGVLRTLVDTQLRNWLEPVSNLSKSLMVQPWLQSLVNSETRFDFEPKNITRLETALYNWTLPIQDYLVSPNNNQLGQNQFRVCFKLDPPSSEEIELDQVDWKLSYHLQALDDEDFLIDAQTIWQHPIELLTVGQRTIENPQETLLKGLGLASRLYDPINNSLEDSQPFNCYLNPIEVYQFLKTTVEDLQNNGLGIILPAGLKIGNEKRLGIKVEAELKQKKGERLNLNSLLSYNLKIAIGNQTISKQELDKLLAQKSPIVEVNGEWIALQPADIRAAQSVLDKSNEPINLTVEYALRLSTKETKTLAKLPVVDFEASGILAEFINNLTNNQSIQPLETPKGFKGELRPYQKRGAGWLAFLEQWGLGACLADDMGLGKTPQFLAFLLHLKQEHGLVSPTLVVCPTSVVNNWEREVQKFAPTLSTVVHHGDNRKKGKPFKRQVENKDLVITSYSLIYRDATTLETVDWQGLVLDEAQNIKNPQAKQSQFIRKLKSGFRMALTGTPVENRLSELWSILDFLNPGFLGNQPFFQRRFAIPIEKHGDRESLNTLRSLVRPFILRRLKTDKDIIQDLPEKQEMNVYCGLSLEQANLYQKLVDDSLAKIEETTGIQRRGLILTLLMQLKQVCNHPAQYYKENSLDSAQRSGKLLRLEEMLEELVDEGDRALIFTQFAEWGKLLQPYLTKKLGRQVLFLYGATPRQQRQEMIDRFQNDPAAPPIFILSLKAGGTGLNLTRANHVFHIDRWWNPAVENQATDRAFRIGQKQNVQVHKFICTGTLEEKINDMIESKKQLAEQTVDAGENWLTDLDTDQLRTLLLLDRSAVIDE